MRVRKTLVLVVVLVVVVGLALFVFRRPVGRLFLSWMLEPYGEFDAAKAPPAPDYADEANWAALPWKEDPSDLLPEGFSEKPYARREGVDVFYIHPTGYFGKHNWNENIGKDELKIPTGAMLAHQANAFNGVGRVFAPEYRQATLYAFLESEMHPERGNGKKALELAYDDVARAFEHFIEHYNEGRPFFIVTHSQGTCHGLRLLAEKVDKIPLRERMIAAYLVGFGVPLDYFEKGLENIKPGISPTQTGCVLTWDTLREGKKPVVGAFHHYPDGWQDARDKPRLCVNPLTWTMDEAPADVSLNLGSLATDKPGLEAPTREQYEHIWLMHGLTGARVEDGALYVKSLKGTPYHHALTWDGNYHLYDFHLFWVNIRENARARAEAWFAEWGARANVVGGSK